MGEKALLSGEPLDRAAIGDMADMAPIGFEKDIPGKAPKPAGPKLSLRRRLRAVVGDCRWFRWLSVVVSVGGGPKVGGAEEEIASSISYLLLGGLSS